MCGIIGFVGSGRRPYLSGPIIKSMVKDASRRGQDSSGLIYRDTQGNLILRRADFDLENLARKCLLHRSDFFVGHSRLVTNGMEFNQPANFGSVYVVHNGIVLNEADLWNSIDKSPTTSLDSEVIAAFADAHLSKHGTLKGCWSALKPRVVGAASCVLISPETGESLLFSNTGSLYLGEVSSGVVISSEKASLDAIGATSIEQVMEEKLLQFDSSPLVSNEDNTLVRLSLVPDVSRISSEESLLEFQEPSLIRCAACILPETMPFIEFDEAGVCNFCRNYSNQQLVGSLDSLRELVKPYRQSGSTPEVIVPFSGGRDSTWALKLIVEDLGLRAVTFTYDWGMITDLGRRNISRVTSMFGVENIVVAADVELKRKNIRKNLEAWLKKPDLGMVSILTAGDKHFYKYLEELKPQLGISLNLWGINPLETTHFKAGFLGIPPDFEQKSVFRSGLAGQIGYQKLRLRKMVENPKYFNSSVYDTLSGEYFRSVKQKSDYFHLFDFYQWNESEVDRYLDSIQWERAADTTTSWRIGDGTAGFYNYIYRTVAGFSEHDTFRSNQIREGQLSRAEALQLVKEENLPRYDNIKWYLEAVGVDFTSAIRRINSIAKLYANGSK